MNLGRFRFGLADVAFLEAVALASATDKASGLYDPNLPLESIVAVGFTFPKSELARFSSRRRGLGGQKAAAIRVAPLTRTCKDHENPSSVAVTFMPHITSLLTVGKWREHQLTGLHQVV